MSKHQLKISYKFMFGVSLSKWRWNCGLLQNKKWVHDITCFRVAKRLLQLDGVLQLSGNTVFICKSDWSERLYFEDLFSLKLHAPRVHTMVGSSQNGAKVPKRKESDGI